MFVVFVTNADISDRPLDQGFRYGFSIQLVNCVIYFFGYVDY